MKNEKTYNKLLTSLVLGVVFIWAMSAILILFYLDNWSDRGTFGDLFGAVNALYSGLAFVGLIYAILLQRKDLELQKNEIKLNRNELVKSAKAQEKSEQALQEQVNQMKITSKLNALNTIINYYNLQISNPSSSEDLVLRTKEKRREAIKEIDLLINRVGDDDID